MQEARKKETLFVMRIRVEECASPCTLVNKEKKVESAAMIAPLKTNGVYKKTTTPNATAMRAATPGA